MADVRVRFKKHGLFGKRQCGFLTAKLFKRNVAKALVHAIVGMGYLQFGKQPTHAMSHKHHVLQCLILPLGVHLSYHLVQVFAQVGTIQQNRARGWIHIQPELVAFTQVLVLAKFVECFHPGGRARKQAVYKHHGNFAGLVRVHHVKTLEF